MSPRANPFSGNYLDREQDGMFDYSEYSYWYNVSYNVRWCDMMHRYWYYNLSWLELVTP